MSILAQSDLTPSINNLVLALSAAATVNILICNRSNSVVSVSIALVPSGISVPVNPHWIEYQLALDPKQPLERGGIPLGTGDQIFCLPSAAGVSITVVGI